MKKLISVILSLVLVICCFSVAASAEGEKENLNSTQTFRAGSDPCADYIDIKAGSWYYSAAAFVIGRGIMGSTKTNKLTFEPNTACTRAMIVSILYRLSDSPNVSYVTQFPDVARGKWYTNAVIWAYNKGVVSGYSNGKFGPDDMITREQMAVILKGYAEKVAHVSTSASASLASFPDQAKVTWSKAAMQWAVAEGLISGKASGGKTLLDPQGNATRAEVASILMRFITNKLEADNDEMRVAVITDVGTIDDRSYNQNTWEGVVAFCEENSYDYTYYRPKEDSTAARCAAAEAAIASGYNVIVMPGYLFGEVIIKLQNRYPNVHFLGLDITSGDLTMDYETYYDPAPNTVCVSYNEAQAGYLAGYAAVADGYRNLGFLGGMEIPAVIRYGYGFLQGVSDAAEEYGVAEEVSVNYGYSGQFYSDEWITGEMEQWYAEGTEVVFACGGGIFLSVAEAASYYGGKVIGVDVDQRPMIDDWFGEGIILTSAMKNLKLTVEFYLSQLQKGNWSNYGGYCNFLSVKGGEFVGLPTSYASWNFRSFTQTKYKQIVSQIAEGSRVVSTDTDVFPSLYVDVWYYYF